MSLFRNLTYRILFALGLTISLVSCVEELELESENFESIVIIEGILTDEIKNQEILLSNSYELDEQGPSALSNAEVMVQSSEGETFNFSEVEPGVYLSDIEFGTRPNVGYRLTVNTSTNTFTSTEVVGEEPTSLDNIESLEAKVNGVDGVAIVATATNDAPNSYYKYEFEETYKIQSPYEKFNDLIINEQGEFEVVPKQNEEFTCYNTLPSQSIIISSTSELSSNSVNSNLINFLSSEDVKIAYRYSILVKQLKINADAHAFYTTLRNLSESENIFSQYQPGFLNGNLESEGSSDTRVTGFFTTAATAEQRLFFNYTDYYDPIENPRPVIYGPCEEYVPTDEELREFLISGSVRFFLEENPGIYSVIIAQCVDCNFFGSNIKPNFWID